MDQAPHPAFHRLAARRRRAASLWRAAPSSPQLFTSIPAARDPTKLSLAGIQIGQALIAILAILAVSEEYGTGMISVTLTAIPRRLTLLAAKAANLAGLTLLVGLIAVAGCLIVGRLILPGAGIDPAHGYALISLCHTPRRYAPLPEACSTSSSSAYSASASPPPSATPPHQSAPYSACST